MTDTPITPEALAAADAVVGVAYDDALAAYVAADEAALALDALDAAK